jgi:hypothetical protein
MILPVVLLAVGAASCLAISRHRRTPEASRTAAAAAAEVATHGPADNVELITDS